MQIVAVERALSIADRASPDAKVQFLSESTLKVKLEAWHRGPYTKKARELLAVSTSCPICMEPIGSGQCCAPIESTSIESWSKQGCRCMFCKACYATYVENMINEHRVDHIPCPTPGCKAVLLEPDVSAATSPTVFARYKELRSVDHKQHLKDHQWRDDERACPRCFVIFHRSSGCDSVTCVRGHRFNFQKAYFGGNSGEGGLQ